MNDIKRYDLEIDCESAYSRMAESEDGDYVQYQAYAAALSAKDARIAELDEVLSDIVKLLAVDKKGAYTSPPVRKILDWSARAELAIASQPSPAPLAATHSEDVIDSLQRAAMMMDSHDALLALADMIDEAAESPMQISIRAADMIRFMVNEGLQDAKPARQVGGDEREEFEAWMHTFDLPPQLDGEVFDDPNYPEADCFGQFVYDDHSTQRCWAAWQARAALAPAAVAVFPSMNELSNIIRSIPNWAGMGAGVLAEAICEHLNRRAISVELLERICARPSPDAGVIEMARHPLEHSLAVDELRALLGKS